VEIGFLREEQPLTDADAAYTHRHDRPCFLTQIGYKMQTKPFPSDKKKCTNPPFPFHYLPAALIASLSKVTYFLIPF
jgi:hypothetical protein